MNLYSIRAELLALRAGDLDFADFLRVATPVLEARAHYFLRRWTRQSLFDLDDLVQELAVEMWRAVDKWDPAKCADIVRYVDSEVGRCGQRRMRGASGWPDKRRGPVATQVYVESVDDHLAPSESAERQVVDASVATHFGEWVAERLEHRHHPGFCGAVIRLVVRGMDSETAAQKIYSDPDMKLTYRLDSEDGATRTARWAVRRASELAEVYARRQECGAAESAAN